MKRNLLLFAIVGLFAIGTTFAQIGTSPVGLWNVTYTIGDTTRTFQFAAANGGTGSFRFRTPSSAVRAIFPAVWALPAPNKVSFSSEVQFPVNNTLRETGTLVFKGTRGSDGRIAGPMIFIIDNVLAATPTPYTIRTGTFVAVPASTVVTGASRSDER